METTKLQGTQNHSSLDPSLPQLDILPKIYKQMIDLHIWTQSFISSY